MIDRFCFKGFTIFNPGSEGYHFSFMFNEPHYRPGYGFSRTCDDYTFGFPDGDGIGIAEPLGIDTGREPKEGTFGCYILNCTLINITYCHMENLLLGYADGTVRYDTTKEPGRCSA